MGRRWKQRKVEAVAWWRFYLPNGENQENYYMQKLVLNLPLRKETPVISPNNVSKTYMEECAIRNLIEEQDDAMTALQDARQRGFSLARLRKMAQSLCDMDWIGEDEFNTFIDEVTTAHRADAVEDEEEVTVADFNPDHADLGNLRVNNIHIESVTFAAYAIWKIGIHRSQSSEYDSRESIHIAEQELLCQRPGEPAQKEPAQKEPAQKEPAQKEPAQKEPAQKEPAQKEPAQKEPAQKEPAQKEPAQKEPAKKWPAQQSISSRQHV
ncbi:uncharacterized protein LOC135682975 [Rhopilema esculentum]|uniref:uncharacterized protein LOC135682975 n=1 Tax=Rhopilema esculentum TaxID=499914 RepID=UPI0031E3F2D4